MRRYITASTSTELPESLYWFLQDVAQETNAFDYKSFSGREWTKEQKVKLQNFKRRYERAAANNDEGRCNDIGEQIRDYLATTKTAANPM